MNMLYDYNKYEVVNLGLGGRTMLKNGSCPYWNEPEFKQVLNSDADKILIMLGTNDAKKIQWNESTFRSDYLEMARLLLEIPSKPELFIMTPPPIYNDLLEFDERIVNERLP